MSPDHLARLCSLQASDDPDNRQQAWEMIATLSAGVTCPGCGATLDPDADTDADPEDGSGWHYDAGWYHVCAPGSPAMRAQ